MFRRSLLWFAVLTLAVPLFAQRRTPSQTDSTDLQVRVVYPDDRPANMQLRVTLVNNAMMVRAERMTNDLGQAEFDDIGAGNYRLKVSGIGIEDTMTEGFTVRFGEGVHYETVQVRPSEKASNEAAPGTNTISAVRLNIPSKAEKEFRKGGEALQQNKLEDARKHWESAISIYPDYDMAYNNLGVVLMRTGHPQQGREAFEKAISLNPAFAGAYVNLARIAIQSRNFEQAQALLQKALTTEPMNTEALLLMSQAELATGNLDQAIANARKVHSLPHEQFAVAHYIAARAFRAKNNLRDAMAEYETYLRESPSAPAADRVRAEMKSLQGGQR
jgi:Tfp pilus assembly protein PilF